MVPKKKGGLGVRNLYSQNDGLLLKQLEKFYNKNNVPWIHLIWGSYYTVKVPYLSPLKGSFWWKEILRLNVVFRGIVKCSSRRHCWTLGRWLCRSNTCPQIRPTLILHKKQRYLNIKCNYYPNSLRPF